MQIEKRAEEIITFRIQAGGCGLQKRFQGEKLSLWTSSVEEVEEDEEQELAIGFVNMEVVRPGEVVPVEWWA